MNGTDLTIYFIKFDAQSFFDEYPRDADVIFPALLAAEDHRSRSHRGIDWFSIARATLSSIRTGRIRGLSTIEQQYVRTVHRRRGSLLACKIRELFLARGLWKKVTKEEVWAAYLWRAYFGSDSIGYTAVRRQFVDDDQHLSLLDAVKIVACLKYPRVVATPARWKARHSARVLHVLRRLEVTGVITTGACGHFKRTK